MGMCSMVQEAFEVRDKNGQKRMPVNGFVVLMLVLLIQLIINALMGQWLWNNSVRKLIPGLNKARWWDTVAIALLLLIVVPQ